jgi:hypothetical protein
VALPRPNPTHLQLGSFPTVDETGVAYTLSRGPSLVAASLRVARAMASSVFLGTNADRLQLPVGVQCDEERYRWPVADRVTVESFNQLKNVGYKIYEAAREIRK